MVSETDQAVVERALALEGAYNARDLGGFRTRDGLRTRPRRVFRMANLHRLTPGDVRLLHEIGIRTVLDLRSEDEIAWTGISPLFEGGAVSRFHYPFLGSTVRNYHAGRPTDIEERRRLWHARGYEMMLEIAAPSIAGAFARIAEPDRHAVIFHCVAGKDRTGLLAALLLRTLGVPDEDIIDDYAHSERERPSDDLLRQMLRENGVDPDKVRDDPWQAPPVVMQSTLRVIDQTWGSTEGYLDAIGVPEEHLAALRELLLEPAP